MTKDREALRTEQLSVGYDGVALLRDVNVRVKEGQIVTLIGPNGAGKSTLLRTLVGLQQAVGGAVYLRGKELGAYSSRELSLERAVLLTDKLKPELLTCEDVVSAGRYPYTGRLGVLGETDHAEVRDAMERLHVWELRARDFMQVSDGQRQRVLLARALCQRPRLLVLDEPTSYLDIRYQIELCTVLRDLARSRDVGIVMSLHELLLARQVSDWLVCVKEGIVLVQGTPQDVFGSGMIDELFDLEPGGYDTFVRAWR